MIGRSNPNVLVEKLAEKLKNEIKEPDWAPFTKTGVFKERTPDKKDWWYMRAASILRKIHLKGPIGVAKLTTLYGGKKNRGYKPEKFYPGSSHIIRTILQQLEKAQLITQGKKGIHKGRITTSKGIALLDKTENEIAAPKKKEKTPKKELKKEKKPETKQTEKPKEEFKKDQPKEAPKPKAEKKEEKQNSKAVTSSAREQPKEKKEAKETPKEEAKK